MPLITKKMDEEIGDLPKKMQDRFAKMDDENETLRAMVSKLGEEVKTLNGQVSKLEEKAGDKKDYNNGDYQVSSEISVFR